MKILAIDIGSAHIKSVIVESKFKRFDLVLQDITSVPDAWEPISPAEQILSPGQLSTLAEIRQRYGDGVDRIVTNLPFSLYSSRFQSFPIKDKRKVLAAVQFAMEDEIPFDLENCIVSSHLYPTKIKETNVLTGFAPIPSLERFIEGISSMGLSPDALMMDDAALATLLARAKGGPKFRSVAVLNLGHRKSGMFFFRDNLPVLHRNTMVAGFHVTEAISTRYGLGMAEAELAKVDRGFLPTPGLQLNPDQLAFSETIRGALEPVFADFQQSMMAYSSRFNDPLEAIYVCGGTSLLPGLPEYLSHRWRIQVLPLEVTKLYPSLSIQPQKNVEWLLPQAAALGVSQASGDGRSAINFRSGKLHAASRGLQLNFQQFVYPAKIALAIYLVAILSVIGQTFLLGRERANKSAQLDRAVQSVLGRVAPSLLASMKASPPKLKSSIDKKIAEFQSQVKGAGATGGPSVLALLDRLSKAVPGSVTTEIKVMDYQPNRVTLTMESPSSESAQSAASTLSVLPFFENAKAGPLENGKGNRKRFTLNATIGKEP
jgi:Tfp pilus assembly PilM family ATPase